MQEITQGSDLDSLTLLGSPAQPGRNLETFPNHHEDRDYTVTLTTNEFSCLCPKTGQPDFARITICYIPGKTILESKSLKLYLASFRNEGAFHEHVTNTILDDLVKALAPRSCKVSAEFAVRGGISIVVDAEYQKPSPKAAPPTEIQSRDHSRERERGTSGRPEAPHREKIDHYDKSQPRFDRGKSFSRSDAGPRGFSRDAYRAKPEERSQEPGKPRWQQGNRQGEDNRYHSNRWDNSNQSSRKGETTQEEPPRKSVRQTTKSHGETRTWRKRS